MASWYVYSGAAGAGTGADWTNAYTTLKAAAEAAGTAAGDSIWVAHDNAETGAVALTITTKNTEASPGAIVCVNRAGTVPPVAADLRTTATVTTTGASAMTITGPADGVTYIYGITFACGTGAVTSFITLGGANHGIYCQNCQFKKLGTTASGFAIEIGGRALLDNVPITFGATGDSMRPSARLEWINTPSAILGTVPTALIAAGAAGAPAIIRGVDLSAVSGTIVKDTVAISHDITLINCKLHATATISAAQGSQAGGRVIAINCDSGATNYRTEYYRHGGTQVIETIIVRTGGASDGTTPISWKIVTSVDPEWTNPFESLPITIWNDATGAKTVSIYGYWDNASVPNNDDIWIEASYLGSAGSPLGSTAISGKSSFLAANAAVPSDSSTWGGGDTTTRFKMSASLTAAMKGPITVTVKAAKASSTFYVDPKIEVV